MRQSRNPYGKLRMPDGKPRAQYGKLIILFILLLILAIVIVGYQYMKVSQPNAVITFLPRDKVFVYSPLKDGKLGKKVIHTRTGPSDREKADTIIQALKRDTCLPENVALYEFVIDGKGTMYLNFSKDLREAKLSAIQEIHATYGIVNSFLGTFTDATRVQILVEGEPVYTLNGLIYTYNPIEFNKQLLED
jgi:hypothetical protein